MNGSLPDRPKHGRRLPEGGQSIVEYIIILMLVGLASVAIVQFLGPSIGNVFSRFGRNAPVAPPSLLGYTPPATMAPTLTLAPTATWPPGFTPSPTATTAPTDTPVVSPTPTGTIVPTGTATPVLGNCQFVEEGGLVVVEAESLVGGAPATGNMNAWVTTTSFGGYAGSSALITLPNDGDNMGLTLNGPRVDYSVYLQDAGTYYFYVRARPDTPNPTDNDSIMAGVAGSSFTQIGSGFGGWSNTSSFSWRRWAIPLSFPTAGVYTINIWMREDGTVVDRFALSTSDTLFADGSTSVGPAQSAAPGGCTGAPPPPPPNTATPSSTPTATRTPSPTPTPSRTPTGAPPTATPSRTPTPVPPTPTRTPSPVPPTPTHTATPVPPTATATTPAPTIRDIPVSDKKDDADEEIANGNNKHNRKSLILGYDGGKAMLTGVRFDGVNVPPGATITSAYITFITDATDSGAASFLIRGQAANNPGQFTGGDYDISSRPLTSASVTWASVAPWTTVNEPHDTPDISVIIQELVNRPGWSNGNAMVFFFSGTGTREAESYDGKSTEAPVLHIEYLP